MNSKKLQAMISPVERKVLPYIQNGMSVEQVAQAAGVQQVEAMRASQFLSNKKVLTIKKEEEESFVISSRGKDVLENGFPEERFLAVLDVPKSLDQIAIDSGLDKQEVTASIGVLRKLGAIQMGKEITRIKEIDFASQKQALSTLQHIPEEFIARGLVEKHTHTNYIITLTDVGKELQNSDLSQEYEERITSNMLKDGSWREKEFRIYDVTTPVPKAPFGRKHFVQEAIDAIKKIWIEMGFSEMEGTMTQTAFWDLDALFVPQDHPAREEQDTFYLKKPGTLPAWYTDIQAVHENGGETESLGWQESYNVEEAKKVLLRTHTTVLSAQTLKNLDVDALPAKFFSVNKVFRNETLDWKHLAEFHQVEGIVVGEGLSLADLIGLQKEFYKKMGFEKIRFRPAYFPYTEPSAEVEVFHPVKKQWMELGGMGVFRPEVVIPLLGKDVPVLAFGLGMERIITDYYKITDLRELYSNNLDQLRSVKMFLRGDH